MILSHCEWKEERREGRRGGREGGEEGGKKERREGRRRGGKEVGEEGGKERMEGETFQSGLILEALNGGVPVIWWSHDLRLLTMIC